MEALGVLAVLASLALWFLLGWMMMGPLGLVLVASLIVCLAFLVAMIT